MPAIRGAKPRQVRKAILARRDLRSGKEKAITEKALYEYLAFILRLYGAQPVAGLAHLHGKKGRGMVHIGAVDAPVTIDEIAAASTSVSPQTGRTARPRLGVGDGASGP